MRRESERSGDRARARSTSREPPAVPKRRNSGHSLEPVNLTLRTPRAAARVAAAAIKLLSPRAGGAGASAAARDPSKPAERKSGCVVSSPRVAASKTTSRVARKSAAAAAAAAKTETTSPTATTTPEEDDDDEKEVVLRASSPRAQPHPWLPYDVEKHLEIEWAVTREEVDELEEKGEVADSNYHAIGRIPFKIGLVLAPSVADDEDMEERQPLCVVVKCFDGIESNVWKLEATIEVSIAGDSPVSARNQCTFDYDTREARLELPVSLTDVLRRDPRYVNDDGDLPIKISISLGRSFRVTRSVVFDVTRAHAHLADAVVEVEGTQLHVSASILARYSMFFYEQFFGKDRVANRKLLKLDCTTEDFGKILHMIYLGETPVLTHTRVLRLLELAAAYRMPELMRMCEDYLEAHTAAVLHSAEVLLKVMALSDEHRLARVQAICVEFIFASGLIETVKQTEAYKRLSTDYKLLLLEIQFASQNQAKSVKPEEPVIKEETVVEEQTEM
ncbi:hypothetical protein PRIPAC_85533 [Pristionchus pacificus]|nr:hypothetical protein PRIPAC_85533 [Pristionchus pacificus]